MLIKELLKLNESFTDNYINKLADEYTNKIYLHNFPSKHEPDDGGEALMASIIKFLSTKKIEKKDIQKIADKIFTQIDFEENSEEY